MDKYDWKHATCEWYVPSPCKLWRTALEAFRDSLDPFPKQTNDIAKQTTLRSYLKASKGPAKPAPSFTSVDYQQVQQDLTLWHLGLFDLRPNSDPKVTRDLGPFNCKIPPEHQLLQ